MPGITQRAIRYESCQAMKHFKIPGKTTPQLCNPRMHPIAASAGWSGVRLSFCFGLLVFLRAATNVLSGREDAQGTYAFTGEVTDVLFSEEPSLPILTNTCACSGTISETNFLFHINFKYQSVLEQDYHVGWDGTKLASILREAVKEKPPHSWGYLESSFVPKSGSKPTQALALALAPEHLLKALGSANHEALWLYSDGDLVEDESSYALSLNRSTGSIENVTARATNFVYNREKVKREKLLLPPPYTNGFVHWTMSIEGRDRISKRPTAFRMKLFYPMLRESSKPKSESDLILLRELEGKLTYIPTSISSASFLPEIREAKLEVSDLRFQKNYASNFPPSKVAAMGVVITNGSWTLDEERQARHASIIAGTRFKSAFSESPFFRPTFFTLCALALLLPLILLRRKKGIREK